MALETVVVMGVEGELALPREVRERNGFEPGTILNVTSHGGE